MMENNGKPYFSTPSLVLILSYDLEQMHFLLGSRMYSEDMHYSPYHPLPNPARQQSSIFAIFI